MKLSILNANWRLPDGRLFHPGDYRVPQDMSEELARRAVAEGVGVLTEPPKRKTAAPENKAVKPTENK
jgi:hypothetical protein